LKTAIVIPTYWTKPDGLPTDRLLNIYDHPTPLGSPGTLGRTLESLRALKTKVGLIIIVASTEPELTQAVENHVRALLLPFADLNPILIGSSKLQTLKERIRETASSEYSNLLSLDGYSHIRNVCLLAPYLLGYEVIILIDDDELIEQPDFIERALEGLNSKINDHLMLAKTGYYIKPGEDFYEEDSVFWWDTFWRKARYMREAMRRLLAEPRFKKVPFALGGNMVVHRKVVETVCFDPAIVRGEDCDFLFNAKLFGIHFFGDNKIWVKHLPPPHLGAAVGFRQDIFRFLYARRKYQQSRHWPNVAPISLTELEPYPGHFLKADIKLKCTLTALLLAFKHIGRGEFWSFFSNVKTALIDAPWYAKKHKDSYYKFVKNWQKLVKILAADETAARILSATR
jgi:glycosyltransferase involved in cell wall biosynthesis